jgi:CHAT domain-containing protein
VEDTLHAVSMVDGRARHHHLGSYKAVLSEFESLRFSLGRMARRYGSPAVQQAALAAYEYARGELDDALVRPMTKQLGDRPLVLVPTGSLHALAWPVLPSLTGRQLTVSPSARSWLTAAEGQADAAHGAFGEQVVLAHGPRLPHAEAEIDELARRYPLAKPLIGADATAQAVAEALDGAQLAHIAAHGRFRSDNPLFSCLELADGPLTVYDLEGMRHAPTMLVLSACDTALSGIRPGDELMGLTSAVFSLGTRTLIASVAPVGDAETRALMNVFHDELSAGISPAQALVNAQREVPEARGFVCFGAG